MDDKVLQKSLLKDYGETLVTANSSTAYTIDLTQGNVFNITLTGNCAFTFSNPPAAGNAGSFTLILTQDGTGKRTVTWPVAVRWPSGTAPTLYPHSGSVNIYTFLTINGGTLWFGADAQGMNGYPAYVQYGYLGAGRDATLTYTYVNRIDYSNDTATAVLKGPLTLARYLLTGVSNSSFGYFGGGYTPAYSRVDRLDYSSDATTAVSKGPLSVARYSLVATGTSAYGYFAGGYTPQMSTIDRVDYSNDTATAVAKGPLSLVRYANAATGHSTYGYFGGGFSTGAKSIVDRMAYATDTATTVAKSPLSAARYSLAASGNSSYGYFSGGFSPPATYFSLIDRIDYANDTTTATAKGPISLPLYSFGANNHNPV